MEHLDETRSDLWPRHVHFVNCAYAVAWFETVWPIKRGWMAGEEGLLYGQQSMTSGPGIGNYLVIPTHFLPGLQAAVAISAEAAQPFMEIAVGEHLRIRPLLMATRVAGDHDPLVEVQVRAAGTRCTTRDPILLSQADLASALRYIQNVPAPKRRPNGIAR